MELINMKKKYLQKHSTNRAKKNDLTIFGFLVIP
jgi:hypothetical protein